MRRAKDDWDVFNFKRIDLILPTQLAEIAMCYLKKKKKRLLKYFGEWSNILCEKSILQMIAPLCVIRKKKTTQDRFRYMQGCVLTERLMTVMEVCITR